MVSIWRCSPLSIWNLKKLENSKDCLALIITSSVPKIFSAGLDITEMYKPNPARLNEFWRALQQMWIRLYGSPLVTAAAINGAAPAGGCLISLCCDIRLMAPGFQIGLNETKLGIVAPFWFRNSMINAIGHRVSERALQTGQMFSSEEAKAIGLVDDVVPREKLIDHAEKEILKYLSVHDAARQITKHEMRQRTVDELVVKQADDTANFCKFIQKESVQAALGFYMQQLSKKAKS